MTNFLDVCKFNPTTGGTTDWTVSSAVTGYQTPALAGAVNLATYRYRAESADLTQWEVGYGIYTVSTTVLTRATVLFNSAGTGTGSGQSGAGTKINFSTTPVVGVVLLAEDLFLSSAAFSATLGGSNQTGVVSATPTKIAFNTKVYDVGTLFSTANNRWTPPAGTVHLSAGMLISGTWLVSSSTSIYIYKNGSVFVQSVVASLANQSNGIISIEDRANGTDFYEVWVDQATTSGTVTVNGSTSPLFTYFTGVWISP